jgi:hypothetical protein
MSHVGWHTRRVLKAKPRDHRNDERNSCRQPELTREPQISVHVVTQNDKVSDRSQPTRTLYLCPGYSAGSD